MAFKDHFSARAAAYAKHRPVYPPALADALADRAPQTRVALDVGAGSGQLSVLLAERFDRVIATDASASQVEHATPHPRVDYRIAKAEASGLEQASVDLVVAAQAAHWFDLDAFYTEVRRVARPDAVVALVSYALLAISPEIDSVLAAFHYGDLDGYWPPERKLVDEGYRTIAFPFEEIALPSVTMTARWDLDALLGYVHTWSGLAALAKTGPDGVSRIERFEGALAEAWGSDRTLVRDVSWPLAIRAGLVRT
jgi:SAM-dependent methyltransferase